jgi:predicted CopG family antitoxin
MPKRTTIIFDDDVYERIVQESVRRYGSTRALSRVVNELLRESLSGRSELLELIYSEKLVHIEQRDFEEFRRGMSRWFEER